MNSLVWLFAGMAALISGYVCHSITKVYYQRKVKKLEKEITRLINEKINNQ